MNVLLSIKPRFAEKILSGEKQYEFRKTRFKQANTGDQVFLYATSPVQRIVGKFKIGNISHSSPTKLWQKYGDKSGIDDQGSFFEYYEDHDEGYAIEVTHPQRYQSKVNPHLCFDDFTPPMSFQYVDNRHSAAIQQNAQGPNLASD